jgi:hypothetical protein
VCLLTFTETGNKQYGSMFRDFLHLLITPVFIYKYVVFFFCANSSKKTSCEEMTPLRCKDRDTDSVLSKSSDEGDVLLNGSSRTSISSLDTLVSVDSGIDCGQISSTSSLSSVGSLGHLCWRSL